MPRGLIQIQINPEKIGLIIGPGGKTIRRLQEETGAKIDIEDTGVVTLSSLDAAGAEAARDKIVAMTEGVQIGRIYEGRVTSIKEFGAFVEILPGKDGLVHISELSDGYVSSVTEICRVGDPMLVKAIAVDDQDRVKLSRKAALAERGQPDEFASRTRPQGGGGGGGGGGRRTLPAGGGPPSPPRRPPGDGGRDRGYGGGDRDRDRGGPPRGPSRPDRTSPGSARRGRISGRRQPSFRQVHVPPLGSNDLVLLHPSHGESHGRLCRRCSPDDPIGGDRTSLGPGSGAGRHRPCAGT